jgi:hypothetical protein
VILAAFTAAGTARAVESSLVGIGADGRLTYQTYANQGETNAVNRMIDFSSCGYRGGGVSIPNVPAVAILSPAPGDDTAAIQAAIDSVEAMAPDEYGIRGAVLLTSGRYQVAQTLTISASGVVLRGEGPDELGTVIEATTPADYDVVAMGTGSASYTAQSGTTRTITTPYVPVGTRTFNMTSTTGYVIGDRVIIQRTPNQFWIDDLNVGQYGWTPDSYDIEHDRYITAIAGNTVTVDTPIVDVIQDKYGGGRIYKPQPIPRISQCGVENLRIESCYAADDDENHPWNAVKLRYVQDCWVRRVTTRYFAYSCVNAGSYARYCTIQDCAFLDPKSVITGGRRYSFNIESTATRILFMRCYSDHSRHDFVTGSRTAGPNAFVDCYANASYADAGPHHRWSTGLLFDNVYTSNTLAVENRATSGSGHGWSGANVVFWNCQANKQRCDAPKGAMNFAIGSTAIKTEGAWIPAEPFGWWEHQNTVVSPRSLYIRQLADRLGDAAVDSAISPAQQTRRIWPDMVEWAGQWVFQTSPVDPNTPCNQPLTEGEDVIFEVIPTSSSILQYRWYELLGGSLQPVGVDAPTLIIPNAAAPDLGRTFFCRVVTDIGPYWSRTAEIVTDIPGLNVALGKPASASSQYNSSTPPAKAVNGVKIAAYPEIWHSAYGDQHPWIRIDLQDQYTCSDIDLYSRTAYGRRMTDFQVQLLDASGAIVHLSPLLNPANVMNSPEFLRYTIPYGTPACSAVEIIRLNDGDDYTANLAEVEVYVAPTRPAAPANVTAKAGNSCVTLNWDANTDGEPVSYAVYRTATPGDGYFRIADALTDNSFTDYDVETQPYYYVVRTADTAGLLSALSDEVSAQEHLYADFDCSGNVDLTDLAILAGYWRTSDPRDNRVDLADLTVLAQEWTLAW